jgi:hypothetical protein
MISKLGTQLGKTVLVSIPSLFSDGKCRPYRLAGVEPYGLWLEGGELATRLLPDHIAFTGSTAAIAFIPFSQIGSVVIAPAIALSSTNLASPSVQDESPVTTDVAVLEAKSSKEKKSGSPKKTQAKRN